MNPIEIAFASMPPPLLSSIKSMLIKISIEAAKLLPAVSCKRCRASFNMWLFSSTHRLLNVARTIQVGCGRFDQDLSSSRVYHIRDILNSEKRVVTGHQHIAA
jgi:hypothetical protein